MKVCFETFGCRLNRAEALDQEAQYLADGWELTNSHADANVIIVRGCSVTQRAQRDSERLVAHIRRKYPFKKVLVTGCLPEAKSALLRTPFAARLPQHAARGQQARGQQASNQHPVPTRTARAYLKVQDGCSGQCTFCIVPRFRGKSVSVDFSEATDRARRFFDAGYREIVVTGCNLSLYASQGKRLPELLATLSDISPECRVRLGSLEPSDVARGVVDVVAERENVCRFLHIPVQSGSNRILAAMKRPYFAKDIDALLKEMREKIPDVALGCDLMTGFPGETDNDFVATKGLIERNPFSRVHVFPYSERPGTRAAGFPGVVAPAVRRARAGRLAKIADGQRAAFARRFIGRVVEIVVEDEETCSGWTSEYLWCACPHAKATRKSLFRIRVLDADGHSISGVPA